MDKKQLTETDIRTKFITPALVGTSSAKWNVMTQVREEVFFTKGRVIVRGKAVRRGEARKADYILYFKPGVSSERIAEIVRTSLTALRSVVVARARPSGSPANPSGYPRPHGATCHPVRLNLTVSVKSRHYAHFFILRGRNDGCEQAF